MPILVGMSGVRLGIFGKFLREGNLPEKKNLLAQIRLRNLFTFRN